MAIARFISDGTTAITSNVSIGGSDANGAVYGNLWVGSTISSPSVTVLTATYTSGLSASRVTTGRVDVQSGVVFSGVTADFRTNSVIQSVLTYAGGASISGLTIGQWGFVFQASGLSIAFSSGKTAYFFGGSTLSAAIT